MNDISIKSKPRSDISGFAMDKKEAARVEFERLTEKYGVRHTFSFDETYDYLMDKRLEAEQKKVFRARIAVIEKKLIARPGTTECKGMSDDHYALKHSFADGMYIRELTVPAGVLTVTKIHSQTHPFFIQKGRLAIYSEKGVQWIDAPYNGITQAGTKRVVWHESEVVIITVHRTNEMDLDKIEGDIVAPNFEELDKLLGEERTKKIIELMKREA